MFSGSCGIAQLLDELKYMFGVNKIFVEVERAQDRTVEGLAKTLNPFVQI
jgi:hypothetical protein